ncbi:preprotein translocase subunit SecE [Enterobacteriaceae endosymbiont of Donacia tomentosa]|uniref:preprotein translocase subunit SecE n=1 Tax=Enterobacteriaceae endosymbiont of Donacia tomentosa TaxID=2675787 RepID=UPI0014491E69|nr:preprotein translocase subunit SecE [Enterobacteriaceae endosymbiont of Donacia tomentosa]QJC31754.1 preprotein translocase subunit SecE [Enterobacteriaceae endosymbiont of Donacia tomentosa]
MNIVEFKKNITRRIIEIIKWVTSIILLISAIFCNYTYQNLDLSIRLVLFCFVITLISLIVLSTNKGKKIFLFIREARIETGKVIWPTYKDTWNTTLVVSIITIIISIIFWILDNFLIYLISFLTGMRS